MRAPINLALYLYFVLILDSTMSTHQIRIMKGKTNQIFKTSINNLGY